MTLTVAIVLGMAVTAALTYLAWRHPARFARIATFVAVVVPLALLGAMLRGRDASLVDRSRCRWSASMRSCSIPCASGQAPGQTCAFRRPATDEAAPGWYRCTSAPNDSSVVVRADAGAPPVVAGDRGCSAAAPLAGALRWLCPLTGGAPTYGLRAAMPWWPIGCTTRIARSARTHADRWRRDRARACVGERRLE